MRLRRPSLAESVVAARAGSGSDSSSRRRRAWAIPVALGAAGLTLVLPQRPLLAGAALALLQVGLAVVHVPDGNCGRTRAIHPRRLHPWSAGSHLAGDRCRGDIPRHGSGRCVRRSTRSCSPWSDGVGLRLRARRPASRPRRGGSTCSPHPSCRRRMPRPSRSDIIADERARLGGQSLAILRDSVAAMHADATAAETDLDPDRIESIAARGRHAVTELRWLLGLLRSAPAPAPPPEAQPRPALGG